MNRIKVNKIRCKKCGDVIQSEDRHDFKICKCGAVAVDGGRDYLRRIGSDFEELSELEDPEAKQKKLNFESDARTHTEW